MLAVVLGIVVLGGGAGFIVAATRGGGGPTAAGSTRRGSSVPGSPSPPPPTFASLYNRDVSGVVRIDATTCSGTGVGSGFLLQPTLVATAAHVVDGAVAVGLTAGGRTVLGRVIGIDDSTDVAMVSSSVPLTGTVFTLADSEPPVGTQVGVIGYPQGGPVSFSSGSISGLNRTVDVEDQARSGLMQTDAALNPGNSGGPVLTVGGSVVGLVDASDTGSAGIGYAIPAAAAGHLFSAWQAAPSPPAAPTCANALGPPPAAGQITNGPDVPAGIVAALHTYFDAIDSGDYASAWAQLSPSEQATTTAEQFALSDATSYDYDINIAGVTPGATPRPTSDPAGAVTVEVRFTSLQGAAEGPGGDQCDNWTLDYTMSNSGGSWLIEKAAGVNSSTHTPC